MRKISGVIAIMVVFGLILITNSYAQKRLNWKGGGGWGAGSEYGRMYNPKTVEALSGEVLSIDKIKPKIGMSYGIHLKVRTANETISVHLGPSWYIEKQDIEIMPKEKVEIKGSRIMFNGKPIIIASEIKMGNDILILRDEDGFPAWSGWRRR